MNITETLLDYDTISVVDGDFSAVIVAAGNSTRMGGISKQAAALGGIPVLARTLLAFERNKDIKNIVIVARECDILPFQMMAQKYMISKLSDITVGGQNREESVKNGILRLDNCTKYVLVHDGARPLVSDKTITDVADAVRKYGAATCGVAVKDTLKSVADGFVENTLERNRIYSVQTPQGFEYGEFLRCITADIDLSKFTDDCSLFESFGKSVKMVDGEYSNIKITTPEDIAFAEGLLAREDAEL